MSFAIYGLLATSAVMFFACKDDDNMTPNEEVLPDRIFYALSDNNKLHEINIKTATSPIRSFDITGLGSGEIIMGIDFRPATGQLYGISSQSILYQINIISGDQQGKATMIGTGPITTALTGTSVGFDFNPTVDRIRVVTSSAQNIRLHPETGAVIAGDAPLNGPASPSIGGVAYTNSRAGNTAAGAGTMLFDIDPASDMLYLQNPPNPGTLVGVGPLGIDISEVGGFDISPDVDAANVLPLTSVKINAKWELHTIDLSSGKLKKLTDLPTGVNITGIAIPSLPVAYALDETNNVSIFNPESGEIFGSKMIGGLPTGVMLFGLDLRPVNGRMHALGSDSKIYSIDLGSGAATELVSLKLADNTPVLISGTSFGVDFNPAADRLRVVSDNGQNLRINVADGVTTVDGALKAGAADPAPMVTAVAYTNSYPGVVAANTTLYDIDSNVDKIFKQSPPNDGILIEPKNLGLDVTSTIGFDIGNSSGRGYAIFTIGGTTNFYHVNLATGASEMKFKMNNSFRGLAVGSGL